MPSVECSNIQMWYRQIAPVASGMRLNRTERVANTCLFVVLLCLFIVVVWGIVPSLWFASLPVLWCYVSNGVWPWWAPSCPSSLVERLPSQGNPSSQGGGRRSAWRGWLLDKLKSSPDPPASSLSWAPLPDAKHRRQSKCVTKHMHVHRKVINTNVF